MRDTDFLQKDLGALLRFAPSKDAGRVSKPSKQKADRVEFTLALSMVTCVHARNVLKSALSSNSLPEPVPPEETKEY